MSSKTIHFVADSTCDIPRELLAKYRISIVPAFVVIGDQSIADDGVALDRRAFYDQLPNFKSHPTTSAPPPALAERIIKEAFEGADHLVILSVPATLSAIHNVFRLGAADLPPDRVTLIDSGTVSMGLGMQVLAGAQMAAETGDVQAVLRAIQRARERTRVYAAADTLEFLRRSGRVGWARASVSALLQIKPVISAIENEIGSIARVRTFGRAIEKLVDLACEQAPLDKLAILHVNFPKGAEDLRARLTEIAPTETFIMNVTPVIGVHIGPGALGVITLRSGWRD